ncbi:MAG: STAS domain-containing protein [Thermodesulfobacteriota bacterium]
MQIFSRKEHDNLVLEIKGRLDALTSSKLEGECQRVIDQGEKALILDLGGVDYISSAGLRTILILARKLNSLEGEMRFCGLRGMVKEVFSISGFNSIFPVFPSVTEALVRP